MKNKTVNISVSLFCLCCLLNFQQIARAETIRVGLLAGFNSILSEEAYQISNGVKLAVAAIDRDSSKSYKFEVAEKDTQLNPKVTMDQFRGLTSGAGHVSYIIGPQTTDEVAQTAPLAQQAQTLLITPSARSDEISTLNNFVFRTRHSQMQESRFFAPYILNQTKRSPLNVLILDSYAGYAFVRTFKPEFSRLGGKFGMFEDLFMDRPNYDQIIHKLQVNKSSFVYAVTLGVQVADLMLEANDAGLNIKFFGTSDNNNEMIIKRAGRLAEGFTFPYAFDPDSNPSSAAFATEYRAAYGAQATQVAANAYDAAMILSLCLEKVGDSPAAVKSCLFYLRDYPGAGGPLSMDRNGNCKRELFVKTVKNGQFVKLSPSNQ